MSAHANGVLNIIFQVGEERWADMKATTADNTFTGNGGSKQD
jgi:hypothetical protein